MGFFNKHCRVSRQKFVHFVLVVVHILIVDWRNIDEMLVRMYYSLSENELNEYWAISNRHIG